MPPAPPLNGMTRAPSVAPSDSHQSMSTDMYRMVDDLVTPSATHKNGYSHVSEESSYGMHSATAAEIFAPMIDSAQPVSRHQGTPAPLPSLPGLPDIWGSPFSPQPRETGSSSPGRPSTAVRLSALQLHDSQQQASAAAALDKQTGYSDIRRNAWRTDTTPSPALPRSSTHYNIGLQLQQSLAQQFHSSSEFSHTSSLYPSTPGLGNQNAGRHPSGAGYNLSRDLSTTYANLSDYDRSALLQSSIWNGSQPAGAGPAPTPPGGQGG